MIDMEARQTVVPSTRF